MSATEAPHTVLVHVNVELPHGTWLDLQEGLYSQYLAAEAAEPSGIGPVSWDEWIAEENGYLGPGSIVSAELISQEIAGAIAVGTDMENTPILSEAEVCIPLAEEV